MRLLIVEISMFSAFAFIMVTGTWIYGGFKDSYFSLVKSIILPLIAIIIVALMINHLLLRLFL